MKYWHRPGLKFKFFLYFSGLVALIIMLLSVAIYLYQRDILQRQAEETAFRLGKILAYSSLNAILLDDYSVMQLLIDSTMEGHEVLSIMLLDTNGTVLAADDPSMRGNTIKRISFAPDLLSGQMQVTAGTSETGESLWHTSVPVLKLDKQVGTVWIRYKVENIFQGLFTAIGGIGLVAMLFSVVLAYYLAEHVTRPIMQASDLARAYGRGQFDMKIPDVREDEIGQMVTTMNQLSGKLKKLIDERSAHEGLVMIGEFASYIIHDLKNPLNGIHLLADGLHRRLPEDSPLRKYSTEILLAAKQVEDFIRRTLDMARTTELSHEKVDINDLVQNAVKEVSIDSAVKTTIMDEQLPAMKGDYRLLHMAVKNLLLNALEATREKGEVSVTTCWDDQIRIIVRDSGDGIPKEKLHAIFRPFFSMKSQGHGLGLAMAKRAITLHAGDIAVQSEPNTGSVFTISLPAEASR